MTNPLKQGLVDAGQGILEGSHDPNDALGNVHAREDQGDEAQAT